MKLSIGEITLILRRRRKWSQRKLAKKAQVSWLAVWLIERDSHQMRIGALARVCVALGHALEIGFVDKAEG